MSVDEALPVARAFSHFLTLANIAEQHHRIRRRRFYERDPQAPPQIGSWEETLGRLRRAGVPPPALASLGGGPPERPGVRRPPPEVQHPPPCQNDPPLPPPLPPPFR